MLGSKAYRIHHAYIDTRQTYLVIPLISGIVPKEDIPKVEKKPGEEIIVTQDGHFDTGVHGTCFLTKYLSENGDHDLL